MLGDLIIESDKGKITGQRVLDATTGPKVESSFTMDGKYKGLDATNIGTFRSTHREDGIQHVEGEGLVTAKDGQGMATWTSQGVSKSSQGKISSRGAVFFRTPSTGNEGGKLSFLSNLVGVFEFEVDTEGNLSSKVWEWK